MAALQLAIHDSTETRAFMDSAPITERMHLCSLGNAVNDVDEEEPARIEDRRSEKRRRPARIGAKPIARPVLKNWKYCMYVPCMCMCAY